MKQGLTVGPRYLEAEAARDHDIQRAADLIAATADRIKSKRLRTARRILLDLLGEDVRCKAEHRGYAYDTQGVFRPLFRRCDRDRGHRGPHFSYDLPSPGKWR